MGRDLELLDRRQFLAGAALSAWLAATHGAPPAAGAGGGGTGAGAIGAGGRPAAADPGGVGRIRSLRLQTAAPLDRMEAFYGDLLGLGIERQGRGRLTVRAGETPITFVAVEAAGEPAGLAAEGAPASEAPFYHFAFNIPENKLLAAREWQLERTPIIPPWRDLRDPRYPDDVTWFRNWNAHSLFFWDPAGNVVEHIARHDLGNAAAGGFDSSDILYASEIGLVVDDVPALAAGLEAAFGLGAYRSASEQFTPVGDELGLLLAMRRGRNLGFGEGRPAGVFETAVTLRGVPPVSYQPPGSPFEIDAV